MAWRRMTCRIRIDWLNKLASFRSQLHSLEGAERVGFYDILLRVIAWWEVNYREFPIWPLILFVAFWLVKVWTLGRREREKEKKKRAGADFYLLTGSTFYIAENTFAEKKRGKIETKVTENSTLKYELHQKGQFADFGLRILMENLETFGDEPRTYRCWRNHAARACHNNNKQQQPTTTAGRVE